MSINVLSLTAPELVDGKKFIDDRGSLSFVNELHIEQFKRFYFIENHVTGFIRAWHGHMFEGKAFIPIQGTFLIGAVKLGENAKQNSGTTPVRHILDSNNPSALLIPPGYANGLKSLTVGAKLMVLSTSSLTESKNDDYRFPYDYWNIWDIENR
jgi:dTDP-4-dehydrorhamnose 3,5-epimerase